MKVKDCDLVFLFHGIVSVEVLTNFDNINFLCCKGTSMTDSIRQKLGIGEDDFVILSIMGFLVSILFFLILVLFISENPVLSAVTLGFIFVLGSAVYLIRKYLEVRKLEAQPSAEEVLKKQYVENENLDIQDYGNRYEKLKEIEEET